MIENTPKQRVLEVSGLAIRAGARTLVQDVTLSLAQGEILCLVGESGSGKSLTASAVMGLLPGNLGVSAGSIRLDGEDLTAASPARMQALRGDRMAMVFQEPMTSLNPLMRVGRQIAEVLQVHRPDLGAGQVRARVLELMGDVHLPTPEALMDAFPHQLSGGQRQRIMIAMALALEPALIIADEPTTALDVTTQAQVLKLFRQLLAKHSSAVLFITHDFDVVRDIADHVAVMQLGRIVEQGPAGQVLDAPRHDYTRKLLAAVPSGVPKTQQNASSDELLSVSGLNLVYESRGLLGPARRTHAVADVGFTLKKGETLGVVGESGSGKSTLGRCITRAHAPTSGRIVFDGVDIAGLSGKALRAVRRRVQMVFQDPYRSLNPRRRILHALIEGPIESGVDRKAACARAAELMALVGLPADGLQRYPHQFSGGQRQRICIARALAMEPDLIVADEAVSALDVSVQAQVLELFEDLQKRLGFAMIFITHDLRVAAQVCDRIGVMQKGRLLELGPVRQVIHAPQHPYTRHLFDSLPGRVGQAAEPAMELQA
ncbi:ABC transporter ATP-binding protein [Bordetella bronchiseptica]|uniref:ABC transporter, ATP-binding protein n=3 Tax=Bordetella bronchiseptica TaxID=518 RepID=A0ABR4RF06_BORBO|nr:ABC transporter ATP-binding protein [Bordetella bronchiseptica]SHR38286.1 ABC transporter-like protein [Mycobacteroides abscessus subsp. abscessus]AWP74820.1 ABC transporter ATP-binding protein [Bordetella bronchiseptica]AWP79597.1 ABC transporter ATP-binding protein [Bordetella bronchiseptica]AWP84411.1 ABC transporter ATP-binding protein [Bordetella bronchiseptica]AWQ09978.1 ABC transporter ATP-binding protein [Bordetella bronchiseptica]